jgi:hypothetical protein
MLVMGSAFFNAEDYIDLMKGLREALKGVEEDRK